MADSAAISARNSKESPLLQLPAEIRNAIWEYAFTGQPVHVTPANRRHRQSPQHAGPVVQFSPCWLRTPMITNQVDGAHIEGPDPHPPYLCTTETPQDPQSAPFVGSRCRVSGGNDCRGTLQLIPAVCTQINREALTLVWTTTTFMFSFPDHFQDFLMASNVHRTLVRRVAFAIKGDSTIYPPWNHVFDGMMYHGYLRRVTSLHLTYRLPEHYVGPLIDFVEEDDALVDLIRAFRRCALVPDEMTVRIPRQLGVPVASRQARERWERQIRALLLGEELEIA